MKNGSTGASGTTYTFTECNNQTVTTTSMSIIYDSDIAFNPQSYYSTSTPALSNYYDLQSVAMHEIGHALGLDHSGIAHTLMSPYGDSGENQQRTLSADDAIAIGYMYPSSVFSTYMGTVSGQVRIPNVGGVFAGHVVAVDADTGNAVTDRLTSRDGSYNLYVPPGNYYVLALPLASDSSHGISTLNDFSGWVCGYNESAPPCCDTSTSTCTGATLTPTLDFTGKYF